MACSVQPPAYRLSSQDNIQTIEFFFDPCKRNAVYILRIKYTCHQLRCGNTAGEDIFWPFALDETVIASGIDLYVMFLYEASRRYISEFIIDLIRQFPDGVAQ